MGQTARVFENQRLGNDLEARFYQPESALNRLFNEAAYLPRCSDNKTASLIRPREYAIKYPYMQINRHDFVSWLIFDLDHENAMIWQDRGLPAPNIIVQNRQNGHAHLFYAITPVCTSAKARAKPIQFMKAVYAAMSNELQADQTYNSGPVAKTPGHQWWRTSEIHNHVYELGELAEYGNLQNGQPWSKKPNLDSVAHSRNCTMFELMRFYAYSQVSRQKTSGSFGKFLKSLEDFAHKENNFSRRGFKADLSLAELKATAKSVARWTWERYTGSGRCHRGIMALDAGVPLKEKQTLSAKRTHSARQQESENKIRAACLALRQQGKALVYTAIAQVSKLSRQTVAKYKHIVDQAKKPCVVLPLRPEESTPLHVKYGAHQVTAPLGQERVSSAGALDSHCLVVSIPLPDV